MARARSALGIPPHGSLSGLHEHDHPQYLHRKGYEPMLADLDLGGFDLTNIKDWPGGLSGHIDRDDHQRYLLADGSRDMQLPNLLDDWHIRDSAGNVLMKINEGGTVEFGSASNPIGLGMTLDDGGAVHRGIYFRSGALQIGSLDSYGANILNLQANYVLDLGAGTNYALFDADGDIEFVLRESAGASTFHFRNKAGATIMEWPSDGDPMVFGSSALNVRPRIWLGANELEIYGISGQRGAIDITSNKLRLKSTYDELLFRAAFGKHIRLQVDSEDEHYVYVENVGTGDAILDVDTMIKVHGSQALMVDDDAIVFCWSGSATSGMKFNTTDLQIESLRAGTPYFIVYLGSANKGAMRLVPVASCGTTGGGVLYYNSGTNRLMCHNGTSWKTISWT